MPATGMQKAKMYMTSAKSKEWWADYSWGSVYMGACGVMWQETGEDEYEKKLAFFADEQVNARGTIEHTNQGLIYLQQWGPLRHAVGGAGILAMYARGLKGQMSSAGQNPEEIMAFAEHQVSSRKLVAEPRKSCCCSAVAAALVAHGSGV